MAGTYTAVEAGDPAAPAAGNRILYPKSDGWYDQDDATISRIGAVNNHAATAAPAVTDDSGDGYSVGSVWIDVTNDQFYICVDATAGAAVWQNVTSTLRASDGSPVALTAGATGALTAAVAPFTLTGGQLAFPAAQNASTDANTLDDYEEGTWTPTLVGDGGGTRTSSTATGTYIKIGRIVSCSFYLATTGTTALTGNVCVSGLPFTSATTPDLSIGTLSIGYFLFAGTWAWLAGYAVVSTTTIRLKGIKTAEAATTVNLANADISDPAGLVGSITYLAAA